VSKQHLYLGASGEDFATRFLKENGYRILIRNYKTKLGEIDIIAKDKDTFVFVEVKTRNSDRLGLPCEAVSRHKRRQVSKVAVSFLKEKNLLGKKARFDVVSIIFSSGDRPKLDLIKNAFELDESFTL
jgi:putative endonuclease